MKKKKTLFFELEPDEVAHAVMLMVCAKYPEHKEHLKKNSVDLLQEGDSFMLMVNGLVDDE